MVIMPTKVILTSLDYLFIFVANKDCINWNKVYNVTQAFSVKHFGTSAISHLSTCTHITHITLSFFKDSILIKFE